ncbi:hypothetical protein GCK72_019468 [Caenorhabditis remanei]|uniref:Uncharacterized protein n=1 Tax=Caenorhabditis remanei TaxID=31234 RepID=A0A6A5GE03_CAERE|nr:hypothetical protein GCK72_019468 [Caenorhabditis remanei]KAF1752913.1 hypothetical protein GCK72_019468 [Caenorhabditis remanei]
MKKFPGSPYDCIRQPPLYVHRTPIEMVFCAIHDDAKSLHSHLACQGTANLVVDSKFFLRYSMTGHCLAISYRPCFSKLASSVDGKFIEVPLNQENPKIETALPRSHKSFDEADYTKTVRTASSAIDQYFTGHILCGLVVLHYEPIPKSVTVIEKLDQICVRPEDAAPTRKTDVAHEQFVKQKPAKSKLWKRIALSESNLEFLDCESLIRGYPSLRKMSMISAKMGPIPNIERLPTGVQNVRPHLEEVGNVPLVAGLFTDSTTAAVEEMVE